MNANESLRLWEQKPVGIFQNRTTPGGDAGSAMFNLSLSCRLIKASLPVSCPHPSPRMSCLAKCRGIPGQKKLRPKKRYCTAPVLPRKSWSSKFFHFYFDRAIATQLCGVHSVKGVKNCMKIALKFFRSDGWVIFLVAYFEKCNDNREHWNFWLIELDWIIIDRD